MFGRKQSKEPKAFVDDEESEDSFYNERDRLEDEKDMPSEEDEFDAKIRELQEKKRKAADDVERIKKMKEEEIMEETKPIEQVKPKPVVKEKKYTQEIDEPEEAKEEPERKLTNEEIGRALVELHTSVMNIDTRLTLLESSMFRLRGAI